MPTYEYVCHDCNNRFEKWQKMSEAPLTTCPTCGGHIRRVFYPAGIVFKGSGFYKTDHPGASRHVHSEEKSESKAEPAAATASTTSSGESKATSKTESKAS
ncbi:MAG TPA: FmdB family zinc ribbon protein [Ktedonobacteraceae bacterium]|nr:FmdB family zinc ribbon protein [Ktedonobacteraceae bacterium]